MIKIIIYYNKFSIKKKIGLLFEKVVLYYKIMRIRNEEIKNMNNLLFVNYLTGRNILFVRKSCIHAEVKSIIYKLSNIRKRRISKPCKKIE